MPGCCADYCTNSDKKGYKMCRIPQCNKRRKVWIENINRGDWIAGPSAALCETHFSEEMWEINCKGQRQLKRTAAPTLFKQSATHLRVCDSHSVHDNMQNELKPVQLSASNDDTKKELYEDIAENCGESDAENHTENSDITQLVTELKEEREEQQTPLESSIPGQKIIATNTDSSRVAVLKNRLAILERMFSRSERSRIDLKRKLDTARKTIRRLEMRGCTVPRGTGARFKIT
ncbi:uncharacterized protein LOC143367606 [Andrena cerasifolii]|uniref:uncharacterized protein LOC143367606 n=1 Tax=Andrena cerasifolii TaxID=2819439 RepID=UPI00403796EA